MLCYKHLKYCLQGQCSDTKQVTAACLVQNLLQQTCFASIRASVANTSPILLCRCHRTLGTLHQKSRVILRALSCASFGKQAAVVNWNVPYMSCRWNTGWADRRGGTVLSFLPNKEWYRQRIQYTVHLTNFLTSSHCNVLSRIRRDKGRGRIINPDWLFASYNLIIIGRSLRTSTVGRKN